MATSRTIRMSQATNQGKTVRASNQKTKHIVIITIVTIWCYAPSVFTCAAGGAIEVTVFTLLFSLLNKNAFGRCQKSDSKKQSCKLKPCEWQHRAHKHKTADSCRSLYLLFEVSAVFLIDQDKVQVVANGELLVDISHRRRQVVAIEEQADWYWLAYKQDYRVWHSTRHITRHFGDKSFRAMEWIGTNNQNWAAENKDAPKAQNKHN